MCGRQVVGVAKVSCDIIVRAVLKLMLFMGERQNQEEAKNHADFFSFKVGKFYTVDKIHVCMVKSKYTQFWSIDITCMCHCVKCNCLWFFDAILPIKRMDSYVCGHIVHVLHRLSLLIWSINSQRGGRQSCGNTLSKLDLNATHISKSHRPCHFLTTALTLQFFPRFICRERIGWDPRDPS